MLTSLRTFRVALAALFFTGCITIEENYTFKKDGSGTMEYVLDMSEMGELIKSLEGAAGEKDGKGSMGDMTAADLPPVELPKHRKDLRGVVIGKPAEFFPETLDPAVRAEAGPDIRGDRGEQSGRVLPRQRVQEGVAKRAEGGVRFVDR